VDPATAKINPLSILIEHMLRRKQKELCIYELAVLTGPRPAILYKVVNKSDYRYEKAFTMPFSFLT
jgi:hypothetical protein